MDKNKKRTDLLESGRQKLQQYRQKKGGKGSKSSSKVSKSEVNVDVDAASSVAKPSKEKLQLDSNEKKGLATLVDSVLQHSENSLVSDVSAGGPLDLSSVSVSLETKAVEESPVMAEIPVENFDVARAESSLRLENDHVQDGDVNGCGHRNGMSTPSSSRENVTEERLDVGMSTPFNFVNDIEKGELKSAQMDDQEADRSGLEKDGETGFLEVEDRNHVFPAVEDSALSAIESFQENREIEVPDGVAEDTREPEEAVNTRVHSSPTKTLTISGTFLAASPEPEIESVGELVASTSSEEYKKLHFNAGDSEGNHAEEQNADNVGPLLFSKSGFNVSKHKSSNILETLKEQLFLAHFEKEMFHLQLCDNMKTDHHRIPILDEKFMSTDSLCEVHVSQVAAELARCRRELDEVSNGREELEKQIKTAKTELDEYSVKTDKLQTELENTQHELVSCRGLVASLSEERKKLEEVKEDIDLELIECRASLESSRAETDKLVADLSHLKGLVEGLQVENANINGHLTSAWEDRSKHEELKEYLLYETEKQSVDLVERSVMVEALRIETSSLIGNVSLLSKERSGLAMENDRLRSELDHRMTELEDCKSKIAGLQEEFSMAVDQLKHAKSQVEHLSRENASLTSKVDICNSKLGEFDNLQLKISHQSEGSGDRSNSSDILNVDQHIRIEKDGSQQILGTLGMPTSTPVLDQLSHYTILDCSTSNQFDVWDDLTGFMALNAHLDQVGKVYQNLEKVIERMYAHSASLDKSDGKPVAPGISKLIQAFESKAHIDDEEFEEVLSTESQPDADPYVLIKEQTRHLGEVVKEMVLDAKKAAELFRTERNSKVLSDIKLKEVKVHHEILEHHANNVEESSIELLVLHEVVKQHGSTAEAKKCELLELCEALREQELILVAENFDFKRKLRDNESRINELKLQLDELDLKSVNAATLIADRLDILHKEVSESALLFDQEWNATVSLIVEAIGRLDTYVGTMSSSLSTDGNYSRDIGSCVAVAVEAATTVINKLQGELEASVRDFDAVTRSCKDMSEKLNDLNGKNELAAEVLRQIYVKLEELINDSHALQDGSQSNIKYGELFDPLELSNYDTLIEQLRVLLREKFQIESSNTKLNSELMDRTDQVEKLNKRCIAFDHILNLCGDIASIVKLEGVEINHDEPAPYLESLVHLFIEKYKHAEGQVRLMTEQLGSKELELIELQDQINIFTYPYEIDSIVLTESLRSLWKDFDVVQSEVQLKVSELEQSEQRVSSLREKLSIAVTKGKGLIVQRDNLKQSIAATSSELEKCKHELQLKDAKFSEIEAKLRTYSEADERMESLESELSYIRNSATALRESFLLKDSVLQRIEEILEDLELPEHFHASDIIEKVDWLAKSVSGSSVPVNDWDQKGSVGGGSYSEVMDNWKEDIQPTDEWRRKYEELQSSFYGLAEQNEMLEQSLMERNNLVQRWEEILDKIDIPSHFRSVEPEERIEKLGAALSEAYDRCHSLQQKIEELETSCVSLTANMEDSQRRSAELESTLQSTISEKQNLSSSLEALRLDYDISVKKAALSDDLQSEVTALQDKLNQNHVAEEHIHHIHTGIGILQDSLREVLQEPSAAEDLDTSSIECLTHLVRQLTEKYRNLSLRQFDVVDEQITEVARQTHGGQSPDHEEQGRGKWIKEHEETMADLAIVKEERDRLAERNQCLSGEVESLQLSKRKLQELVNQEEQDSGKWKLELEKTLADLALVKEESDRLAERNQYLSGEVDSLQIRMRDLQELLNQEEQKSASVKGKLEVAVKRGKSLVQQRDSMKKSISDLTNEVENLRSNIAVREKDIAEYEQKIKDLSADHERIEGMESEIISLRNCLAETDAGLQEAKHDLGIILNALADIEILDGFESSPTNHPVEKLQQIRKVLHDLRIAVAASETDSKKSKRAAELLHAELNEVQERNDGLLEELSKTKTQLTEMSKERDFAEAARRDSFSRLENLSAMHSEQKNSHFSQLMVLKSGVEQLGKSFSGLNYVLDNVLPEDLKLMHDLGGTMKSLLLSIGASDVDAQATGGAYSGVFPKTVKEANLLHLDISSDCTIEKQFSESHITELWSFIGSHLQDLTKHAGSFKEKLHSHSFSSREEAKHISETAGALHRAFTLQKDSFDTVQRGIARLESVGRQKNTENVVLRRNVLVLYEACKSSIFRIGKFTAQLAGKEDNQYNDGDLRHNLESSLSLDDQGLVFSGSIPEEEHIRSTANKLSSLVNEFCSMQGNIVEASMKEAKATIASLQEKVLEKDKERDRICQELVSQIKEAEETSKNYLLGLQSAKRQVHDLQGQLDVIKEQRRALERSVEELRDQEATSVDLQERVRSLTDVLASKEQEIETLLQALDEEDAQMDGLKNKITELERLVQQKDIDLENAEASRGKAVKKLSTTVSKFDELHHLSTTLLSEVEKLQSQLGERDAEISFLRQEITRCTTDALAASKLSNVDEMQDLLKWLTSSLRGVHVSVNVDDLKSNEIPECKEIIQKSITSIISELEGLREVAGNKDNLLHLEMNKAKELLHKVDVLESSLREKESQLNLVQGVGGSREGTTTTSEIIEVEPVINKRALQGTFIAPQVRSSRKVNNDQVAIAIDMIPNDVERLEDEDDDKAHGFKSLTTSKVVPRFARPVTDMIDGLWVSCDRALMRQPSLRLGVIIYWAIMHALLATFVV